MIRKPHIVHLVGTMGMGGAQKQVLNLVANPLLNEYRQSIICAISREGEFLQPALAMGIGVYECPIRWPKTTPLPSYRVNRFFRDHLKFTFSRRLATLLMRIDADLVHSHLTGEMLGQANAILKRAKLPWIWTLHGLYKSRGEGVSEWPAVLKQIALHDTVRITGVSSAALNEVREYNLVQGAKLSVVYNGIDVSSFVSSAEKRLSWRDHLGIPRDALLYGTGGRLIAVKRYDLAVQAFAALAQKSDRVQFVLAGEGELLQALKNQTQELGISDRFHFLGFQPDIRGFLNTLDVFVLTSDSEGLPIVLLEALAAALPCIATAVGGVPEILGEAGILIPPGSKDALAQAMSLLLNTERRTSFGQKSAAIISRFDITNTASQYKALYDELRILVSA